MAIINTFLSTTSATTVFTAAEQQAITVIYLCNTTGNTILANVYAVPDGSSAVANTQIYTDLSITAQDTYVISTEKLILDNADTISVSANIANAITVTVSSATV